MDVWTLRKFRDCRDFFRIFRDPVKTVSYVQGRVLQFEQMLQFFYLVAFASATSDTRVPGECLASAKGAWRVPNILYIKRR